MDHQEVCAFFFEAMIQGWAGDCEKHAIPGMPGYKSVRYTRGLWLLQDAYCVNPSTQFSSGSTTIWYEEQPVWVMAYAGWYDKVHIPFLKSALLHAYNNHSFLGGRGPDCYKDDKYPALKYVNRCPKRDFIHFRGAEKIFDRSYSKVFPSGWHEYQGHSLIMEP